MEFKYLKCIDDQVSLKKWKIKYTNIFSNKVGKYIDFEAKLHIDYNVKLFHLMRTNLSFTK